MTRHNRRLDFNWLPLLTSQRMHVPALSLHMINGISKNPSFSTSTLGPSLPIAIRLLSGEKVKMEFLEMPSI